MLERLQNINLELKKFESNIIMTDEYETIVGEIEEQFFTDIIAYFGEDFVQISDNKKEVNVDYIAGIEEHENTTKILAMVKQNNIFDWDTASLNEMAKIIHTNIIQQLLDW